MKNLLSLLAALSIGAAGCSQAPTNQGAATAPVGSDMAQPLSAPYSTDTRQVDERGNWTAWKENPTAETDYSRNWRMSDGFNNDPDNSSGAPGPDWQLGH